MDKLCSHIISLRNDEIGRYYPYKIIIIPFKIKVNIMILTGNDSDSPVFLVILFLLMKLPLVEDNVAMCL